MIRKSTKKWYVMPAGQWCGVFVEEKVAGQLQEILSRHAKEIADFLYDCKDALLPYHWTLAYPNGKQEIVHYAITADQEYEIDNRIELFEMACELKCIDDGIYLSDNKSCIESDSEVVKYYTELHKSDNSPSLEVE